MCADADHAAGHLYNGDADVLLQQLPDITRIWTACSPYAVLAGVVSGFLFVI